MRALQIIRRGLMWSAALILTATPVMAAMTWFPLGPFGGDARSIAADPQNSKHLYMGTATGWIYESMDGGVSWKRLSMVAKRDDLVVEHILLDPKDNKHLIVGGYMIDHPDGGLYESHDGGLTWYTQAEMRGQSVRALAAAPSDSKIMVAGTLQGVYRTQDGGAHWKLISPPGSTEIHEVESVAVDPVDPNVIYAGTWHLPWKTVDGGENWVNIKQGIIDDSDVFSIIVDPTSPQTVYASACSGIYKSTDAGAKFTKVQGIPSSARRTRKLAQDPQHLDTVYAGTTEGLYRTLTGGTVWSRMTDPNVIINDVYIDPNDENHVVMATDRAGILVSNDGGVSFKSSNRGFTARQVTAFAADPHRAATIYVGVVNDKDSGGVFKSTDGGVGWQQESTALDGRDIFSLTSTQEGTLLAGTGHGIFRLDEGSWTQSGALSAPLKTGPAAPTQAAAVTAPESGQNLQPTLMLVTQASKRRAPVKPRPKVAKPAAALPTTNLDAAVYALIPAGDAIYAGTSLGLIKGMNDGTLWSDVPSLQMPETRFVAAYKGIVMAASLRQIELSMDEGKHWDTVALPKPVTQISAIAVDDAGNLWVGAREGAFYSTDDGANWKTLRNLYVTQVSGMYFDAVEHRVLVTASNSTLSFAVHVSDFKVDFWDTGWNLRFVRPVGDHMVGATLYDGIVVQPAMMESPLVDAK